MSDWLCGTVFLLLFQCLAAAAAAQEKWRLEDFPEDPHGDGPCFVFDPDSFLRDEDDAQLVAQTCTATAQYYKQRRLHACENEPLLAFKVVLCCANVDLIRIRRCRL